MRFLGFFAVLALGLLTLTAPQVHAGYSWTGSPTVVDADDPESVAAPGQDILAAWHAMDVDYHYFRIDLQAAPDNTSGYAQLYRIYINTFAGGGSGQLTEYVPLQLSGIDVILDSHYYGQTLGWMHHDYHVWNGTAFDTYNVGPSPFFQTRQNGARLEWQVIKSAIGDDFSWHAVSHDLNYGTGQTHDIASVPVPSALHLLGVGMICLVGYLEIRQRS